MAAFDNKDYYAVLGVSYDADQENIRKAFQAKAVKLHPDVSDDPDAEEKFKELSEAYAILSDADKKRRYDTMRGNPFASGPQSPGSYDFGSYTDFFMSDFTFNMQNARPISVNTHPYNPEKGSDVIFQISLSDESARNGMTYELDYEHFMKCAVCNGTGSREMYPPETCPTCNGTGRVVADIGNIFGITDFNVQCPECQGSGKVVAEPCQTCGCTGRVNAEDHVTVRIPPNTHDGDEIRIAGKGNAGTNESEPGDYVCKIEVTSERVSSAQMTGAWLVGFSLPILVASLFTISMTWLPLPFALVALVVGVFIVSTSEGISEQKKNRAWWSNLAKSAFGGMVAGIIGGVVLVFALVLLSGN